MIPEKAGTEPEIRISRLKAQAVAEQAMREAHEARARAEGSLAEARAATATAQAARREAEAALSHADEQSARAREADRRAKEADPDAVLGAWRKGESLVHLLGGGWAPTSCRTFQRYRRSPEVPAK